MEKEYVDLLMLQAMIRGVLEEDFSQKIWVKAEVSALQVKGGNCYLELSQTGPKGLVAKVRAMIWKDRYPSLAAYFREVTGSPLASGITLLMRVQVSYSALFGLTLFVDEIEPELTLGEAELQRRKTIARLTEEGFMDMQKALVPVDLPYALAVISAPTAAGFGDFCRHLDTNAYGFKLRVDLFEATMQGASAPESIVDALDAVQTSGVKYDAVLILRGGGSNLDLACFDDYGMCVSIATCPIPVYSAIGHERDYHVADMVAHEFVKTPTALADLFLDSYMAEDEKIASFATRLRLAFTSKVSLMESRLEVLQSRIISADPRQVLSRGYALVADARGVVVKKAADFTPASKMKVLFADGTVEATVEKVEKNGR